MKVVRDETPRLTFTYSLALCILFLDRLNQATDRIPDPANREIIQRLAVQMMAAQNGNGSGMTAGRIPPNIAGDGSRGIDCQPAPDCQSLFPSIFTQIGEQAAANPLAPLTPWML